MTRDYGPLRCLLLGGWVLIMPPVPLGTALPPLSTWTPVSTHETAGDCDRSREAMRKSARLVVTRGAGASALQVAGAMGQLQARCIASAPTQPPAEPAPAKPPVAAVPPPTR
ncbi:MAG: hypothetical protein ABR587_04090 [Candidatus Binatia bacterium]